MLWGFRYLFSIICYKHFYILVYTGKANASNSARTRAVRSSCHFIVLCITQRKMKEGANEAAKTRRRTEAETRTQPSSTGGKERQLSMSKGISLHKWVCAHFPSNLFCVLKKRKRTDGKNKSTAEQHRHEGHVIVHIQRYFLTKRVCAHFPWISWGLR